MPCRAVGHAVVPSRAVAACQTSRHVVPSPDNRPPRHRATAPPRHRATAPPRHRATAPPRHRATAPPGRGSTRSPVSPRSGIHRRRAACLPPTDPGNPQGRARRDARRRLGPFTAVIHRLSTIGLPASELLFPCHSSVVHRLPTGLSTSYTQIIRQNALHRRSSTLVFGGAHVRIVNAGTGTFRANVFHTNPQASTGCLPSRWTKADTSTHRCGLTLWISMWTDTQSDKRSHRLWTPVDYLLKVLWTTSQ